MSLALHPDLAPYKVAVLPLLKKRPEIVELCHRIKDDLKRHTMAVYDDTAAIGKLYRTKDEIGTPWCITVDVDSLEDGAVTVRDRDSMAQKRIPVEGVTRLILDRLEAARTPDDIRSPRLFDVVSSVSHFDAIEQALKSELELLLVGRLGGQGDSGEKMGSRLSR